jgi:hypothetical protein
VTEYRDLVPNGQIESSSECSEPLLSMVAEGILDAALVMYANRRTQALRPARMH